MTSIQHERVFELGRVLCISGVYIHTYIHTFLQEIEREQGRPLFCFLFAFLCPALIIVSFLSSPPALGLLQTRVN